MTTQKFTVSLTAELTFPQLVALFGASQAPANIPTPELVEPEAPKVEKAPKAKKVKAEPVVEPKPEPAAESDFPEEGEEPPMDLASLKKLAQDAVKASGMEEVELALRKVGAAKLSAVPPERIPQLVAALKGLLIA